MQLQKANRRRSKMRLLIQGASGSGKTMSALLLAHGLSGGDWTKVAVIDSENHSADLYADLGPYNVLPLSAPFTPEKYAQAIGVCEEAGMEVIVLDSITHEWENLLDYHGSLPGNSFTAWGKVTPRHAAFVDRMLRSPAHVIATARAKTEYALAEKNGKQVPEKLGMKSIQRDGIDYEFSLVFELDLKHHATATKDRTRLFADKPPFRLDRGTGSQLLAWCQTGTEPETADELIRRQIGQCGSLQELLELFRQCPAELEEMLKPEFHQQKLRILSSNELNNQLSPSNVSQNGKHAN
jgi:hypothetical protein